MFTPEVGEKIGEHNGAHYFTIGQRKGINVGGKVEPLFVIDTDTKTNIIYVGQGTNHKGLFRPALKVIKTDIHWVREDLRLNIEETLHVKSRIRYRQPLVQGHTSPKKRRYVHHF